MKCRHGHIAPFDCGTERVCLSCNVHTTGGINHVNIPASEPLVDFYTVKINKNQLESLRAQLAAANARISELTQGDPSWFDASPADAFRMWAEDKKRLTAATDRAEKAESQRDRMREPLERIAAGKIECGCACAVDIAEAALKEVWG